MLTTPLECPVCQKTHTQEGRIGSFNVIPCEALAVGEPRVFPRKALMVIGAGLWVNSEPPKEKTREQLLAEVDLQDFADELTVNLPYGRKRALELATTLALEPELMLLDEPTQGMGHEDVDRVTQLIKKVSANRTILMVEHNMNVVSSIADTISVLQRGQVIAEGPYAVVSQNPQVLEAYMGTTDNELEGAHG